jgi:hypothetical protein
MILGFAGAEGEPSMRLRIFPFMRVRILPAAAIALVLTCAPAYAGNPSEAFLQRVDQLVRWIAAHSGYPAEIKAAPRFVFLSPEAIRHSFSGASMGYSDETSTVQAAQTRGTIYLPVSFTLGRDDYILVHELVHHLQDESGKVFPCLAAREYEAYAIQTSFVQQTGSGEMPNDMLMLMLRCDIR